MTDEQKTEEQIIQGQEVLKKIKISRIILPIILGITAVLWLLLKRFDPTEFAKIKWTTHTLIWISIAILFLIIRHLAYSLRLYIISNRRFSYTKCIELLFIWEFSTAVAPTSTGGAAVALFVLIQEKLSTAKTVTIVIYKVLLDSIFFITVIPTLFFIFGLKIIRPDLHSWSQMDGWGYSFLTVYALMLTQGVILFFGLFLAPSSIKKLLLFFTKFPLLNRFKDRANTLGSEIEIASEEIRKHSWRYHLGGFCATIIAWVSRFLLINCLIIAIIPTTPLLFHDQILLFARVAIMYIVTLFSPTPGGAGIAEIVFGGFLSDYIPATTALVIAFLWRILTYYSYLLAGAFVVPNWINNLYFNKNKDIKESESKQLQDNDQKI